MSMRPAIAEQMHPKVPVSCPRRIYSRFLSFWQATRPAPFVVSKWETVRILVSYGLKERDEVRNEPHAIESFPGPVFLYRIPPFHRLVRSKSCAMRARALGCSHEESRGELGGGDNNVGLSTLLVALATILEKGARVS